MVDHQTSGPGLPEEAQAWRARYRTLLDSAADAIILTDLEQVIEDWNPAAEALYGWSREEAIGRPLGELIPTTHDGDPEAPLRTLRETGRWTGEATQATREGQRIRIQASASLIRDASGEPVGMMTINHDLSTRLQAEAELRRGAHFVDQLFESSAVSTWVADAGGTALRVNSACLSLFGATEEEVIGKYNVFQDALIEDQGLMPEVRRVFEEGISTSFELDYDLARAGHVQVAGAIPRTVKALFTPILEKEGRVAQVIVQHIDLSEIRDAVAALRQREKDLSLAEEVAKIGSWRSLPASGELHWSRQVYRIHGIESDGGPIEFDRVLDLVTPEDRPLLESVFRPPYEVGRLIRLEYRIRRADGVLRRVETIGVVDRIPGSDGIVISGTLQDLTERKRAEGTLLRSEARFRSIYEHSAVGMSLVSPEGRFLSINPAMEKILGYSSDALIRRSLLDITHPEDRERSAEAFQRLLEGEVETFQLEKRYLHRDGATVWGQVSANLIRDDEGQPLHAIAQIVDISPRKLAEEERSHLEDQLRQSQKMEAIGRLAGGIAHDFNNLLTVIQSYANLIGEELREGDPLKEDIGEIRDAGERASHLTRQLLAFSRRQTLEPTVLDPNALLTGLEKILGRLIGEHIELRLELDPGVSSIFADPGQIEQVLMNLVINARDAMPEGGQLRLSTAEVILDAAFVSRFPEASLGPHVRIAVCDTGAGMSEEIMSSIFEPFFTTKDKGRGTGLGLSTVYGIVRQSGGSIEVESEPDEGSCFRVYLPRAESEARPRTTTPAPRPIAGGACILVVEDERVVRELARRVLERAGHEVLVAADGGEALLVSEEYPGEIDLILSDVVMPKMSGKELADRLAPLRPEAKVLFMSGYLDDELGQHGILDATTHFIAKPFSGPELLEKVRTVLDE